MPKIQLKIALLSIGGAAAIVTIPLASAGWYVSEVIEAKVLHCEISAPALDVEIAALEDRLVALHATPSTDDASSWNQEGFYGLRSPQGYAKIGDIIESGPDLVLREYLPIAGYFNVGAMVRVDPYVFSGNPKTAFQIPFDDVIFSSPLGKFPAWRTHGDSDTWVIMIHGRSSNRQEGLRTLPLFVESGHPTLSITYRNDEGVPADPRCFYNYGKTEWEDLEGAVKYAVDNGAEDVILVAFSYGGSIVMNFLNQSQEAHRVRGIIMDAPLLNLNSAMEAGAKEMGIPGLIFKLGKSIASARFDTDWNQFNYLCCTRNINVPVLLFHGDADAEVPVETSDQLAQLLPDKVEYVRVPEAGHVLAWNADRDGYVEAVRDYLARLTRNSVAVNSTEQ